MPTALRYLLRTILVAIGLAVILFVTTPLWIGIVSLPNARAVRASIADMEAVYSRIEKYRKTHHGRNPATLLELAGHGSSEIDEMSTRYYRGYTYKPHAGPDEPLVGCCALMGRGSNVVVWVTGDGNIYMARARLWPKWKW